MTPDDEQRFWSKVQKTSNCWLWTAAVHKKTGYGQFQFGVRRGSTYYIHRLSYIMAHGSIPAAMQIDHTCNNRRCVNPGHLRPATNKQNHENLRGPTSISTSGVRGVYWHKPSQKWQAQVGHHGRHVYLGLFDSKDEAESAVIAKRNELFTHNDRDRVA